MALIEEQKKGREDGGFTRTLGDAKLGSLISQVHATSISAGTELEKLICEKHSLVMTKDDFSSFVNKKLQNGTYLIPKKVIKSIIKKAIGSKSEPDFLVIVIVDSKAYVVEVKDGDAFDTKKSAGEIASCREFAKLFAQYLIKIEINYEVEIRVCCFNQTTKAAIVSGLKGEILISEAWTGADFCKVLGISYTAIVKQREVHQERNFEYFIERLLTIDKVSTAILKQISDNKTNG
jgi:hypothetical protein